MSERYWMTAAAVLAAGIAAGGWTLGSQVKAMKLGDRYVSVRGLAERDVKSDLAIWSLDYKEAGDDLTALSAKTDLDKQMVLKFLSQEGIQPTEIEVEEASVTDNRASQWAGNNKAPFRYIIDQGITVRTTRVDEVATASQHTMNLLRAGIALDGNEGQNLTYKFTGLNAIKPDMITEATRNARAAADRFAQDSGSSVGTIRQATQGVFAVLAQNSSVDTGESEGYGSGANADSSLMKTVRVVTNVDYYLEH